MIDEPFELVYGSGNVFRDFGYPDADVLQTKAILAAEIIKLMDREGLTVKAAHARTGRGLGLQRRSFRGSAMPVYGGLRSIG